MSANSLVFSCLLSSPSTMLTNIDLHVLNVVIHVSRINKKPFWSYTITTAYHILCSWKIPIEVIHPYVSDLRGLPLLVVLAVHIVVNHQLTLTNVVSHIEGINIFHVNHHQQTVQRPLRRKFLLMWCILMSATSLVFSSRFYSPSTVSSTTNSLVLDVWSDILKVKKISYQPP